MTAEMEPIKPDEKPVEISTSLAREIIVGFKESVRRIKPGGVKFDFAGDILMMALDGEKNYFPTAKAGMQNVASLTKLPVDFVKLARRDDADLAKRMISFAESQLPPVGVDVVLRGDEIKTVTKAQGTRLTTLEVFDAAVSTRNDFSVEKIHHNGNVSFRLLTHIAANPPKKVGDITRGGVMFNIADKIEAGPYLLRLACTNGAIREVSNMEKVTDASRTEMLDKVMKLAKSGLIAAETRFLPQFVESVGISVDDPVGLLVRLTREHNPGPKPTKLLLEQATGLPRPCSWYDVTNLITRVARDFYSEDNEQYGWLMMNMGGHSVTASHASRCHQCLQNLS